MRAPTIISCCAILALSLSCAVTRDLELRSAGPEFGRQMSVYLESRTFASKARLAIEIISDKWRRTFSRSEIANAMADGSEYETFELGICLSESAWPTPDVVVVLVKNCLGHVTLVAIDFRTSRIGPGDQYRDSIRQSLQRRYPTELIGNRKDPLQWINEPEARLAYQFKRDVSFD